MRRGLDESRAEKRHHRHGHRERGEQRKHDGQRQRGEQKPAHAVEKGHGEEDDDRGERRGQHGQGNFASALFRSHCRRFAQFQVTIDVFQHDDRVIDQAREGERQPAQHHAVDGVAAE